MISTTYSILFMTLIATSLNASHRTQQFAVAVSPTPVLNTKNFKSVFGGNGHKPLKADECGQIRELEFIALPGTVFNILQDLTTTDSFIYRVTTNDYPDNSSKGLFIDSRFVRLEAEEPSPRQKSLPTREEIIKRLRALEGARYVWGGNINEGIPDLPFFYPPADPGQLTPTMKARWQLAGVDCSGLLYEATSGWTPRNTSALVKFGDKVNIEGLSSDMIIEKLMPLDLIVWPGHVLIVLDRGEIIESRLSCNGGNSGVITRPLKERITEILGTRKPLNFFPAKEKSIEKNFAVRRWHYLESKKAVK